MTDWLEWVLEQVPEEDQTEQALSWGIGPAVGRSGAASNGGPEPARELERPWTETAGQDAENSAGGGLPAKAGGMPGEREAAGGWLERSAPAGMEYAQTARGRTAETGVLKEIGTAEKLRRAAAERTGERNVWTAGTKPESGRKDGTAGAEQGSGRRNAAGEAEPDGLKRQTLRAEPMEQAGILRNTERPDGGAEGLYRELVRAGRELEASRPAARTVVTQRQSVDTPSLTVDELDRAVRRDSRRYDGGMELY